MKILIFEDEIPAFKKLKNALGRLDPNIEIAKHIDTVEEGIQWLEINQESVDLIFMDINLADGLCFEIFKKIKVWKPVIFITAHDDYTLEAFKVNSIDYLLKPLNEEDLELALSKFKSFLNHFKLKAQTP